MTKLWDARVDTGPSKQDHGPMRDRMLNLLDEGGELQLDSGEKARLKGKWIGSKRFPGLYTEYKCKSQRVMEDFNKKRIDEDTKKQRFNELHMQSREALLDGYSAAERVCPPIGLLKESLYIYSKVYTPSSNGTQRGVTFAWKVAGDFLCHAKRLSVQLPRQEEGGEPSRAMHVFAPEALR
eukprot:CAMPEP_0119330022 /NCGR_PEP_ID=MMETSP1333-20130426/77324_1 /TAXON_ID=418940 /ORGANISM="Scyphosphaera apsteinii, Strain RCC1455" /LENGTH=180 /DNA_ID=CAMNT_0007339299 /DNA_START=11 /DNA_END=549 /DNA_ORIENTATION=+